jgi:PleD family two-component response regulator
MGPRCRVAVIPVASGISELAGGRVNGTLLVAGGGLVTALVMVRVRRLSYERERAERALSHLASHDGLTGLVNRRVFVDLLGDELSRTRLSVILFCDPDGFKKVNDRRRSAAD